jgi:oligosaccharyltransferase complex subunit beta
VLAKYGQYLYKNLVIFSPSVEEFGGSLSVEAITKFVDDGGNFNFKSFKTHLLNNVIYLGNILIAGSINSGDVLREITAECGFEVDEEGAAVIDHLNYDVLDQGKVMLKTIVFKNSV